MCLSYSELHGVTVLLLFTQLTSAALRCQQPGASRDFVTPELLSVSRFHFPFLSALHVYLCTSALTYTRIRSMSSCDPGKRLWTPTQDDVCAGAVIHPTAAPLTCSSSA